MVHDQANQKWLMLQYLLNPKPFVELYLKWNAAMLSTILQAADHLLTVSRSVRKSAQSKAHLQQSFLAGASSMIAGPEDVIQVDVLQVLVRTVQQTVTLASCTAQLAC